MRRAITYIMILLVLGGIFGLSLRPHNNPIIGSTVDIIAPAVAYADSDTVKSPMPPPPPPPID
ncbi:MAG: hypothetical protein ABIL74_03970 [candidate division WOR-3 bacterium]